MILRESTPSYQVPEFINDLLSSDRENNLCSFSLFTTSRELLENKEDNENKENLRQELKTQLPDKNIKTSSDHIIVFFANKFPLIMLFVALVIFIWGLIYIINL